jgi:hypothetical protein
MGRIWEEITGQEARRKEDLDEVGSNANIYFQYI